MYEEYKDYAINLVCKHFEVDRNDLLGGKRTEDVVDARSVLVHVLTLQGMLPITIQKWTGISAANQPNLLHNFEYRSKASTWFYHQMICLIRDAKKTCPVAFKAHDKDGNIVTHNGAFK